MKQTYKPDTFRGGLIAAQCLVVQLAAKAADSDSEREAVAMVAASVGASKPFKPEKRK